MDDFVHIRLLPIYEDDSEYRIDINDNDDDDDNSGLIRPLIDDDSEMYSKSNKQLSTKSNKQLSTKSNKQLSICDIIKYYINILLY